MSSDARKKPVKLQVNTFGATWHDVLHFDSAIDVLGWEVMDTAERLARMDSAHRTKFRIAAENGDAPIGATPDVLMTWSLEDGWKEATHA